MRAGTGVRSLVWFRGKELRVADHAALALAVREGDAIPVFVLDPYFFAPDRAARWPHRMQFLLEAIGSLQQNLARLGSRLLVVAGKSVELIPRLAERWRVDRVAAQRWTEPFARERDRRVAGSLRVPFELLHGETLLAPETLRTGGGTPFAVFTPFSRAFRARAAEIGATLPTPRRLPPLPGDVATDLDVAIPALGDLGISHNPKLLEGGEAAGRRRLKAFIQGPLAAYPEGRDRMDWAGTSRLSADLKFGTVSPRTVWNAIRASEVARRAPEAARIFLRQLVWREFAYATLWDRPTVLDSPFRADFENFPWRDDEEDWRAWVEGTTGYPVVDAAARQLLGEGMVHNRARMIAASFLAKHLMIDFRRGEKHYFEQLVDGDWANNDMGWQWSAGSGCDAQPYFRIFNPITQGKRFDPEGTYVRQWIPELAQMPAKYIHQPWEAPPDVLRGAGVILGETYPAPRVAHAAARDRFLRTAEAHIKGKSRKRPLEA
jgi:deoxyribodipyrimidine photo-lyase